MYGHGGDFQPCVGGKVMRDLRHNYMGDPKLVEFSSRTQGYARSEVGIAVSDKTYHRTVFPKYCCCIVTSIFIFLIVNQPIVSG